MFELKIKFETEQEMIDYCTSHVKETKTTKKVAKKAKKETKKAEVKTPPAEAVPEDTAPPKKDDSTAPILADIKTLANAGRDAIGWDETVEIISKIKETLDIVGEIPDLSLEKMKVFREELSLALESAMRNASKKEQMKEII